MARKINDFSRSGTTIDQGLRAYFLNIFSYMGLGLALTGAVSLFVATSPALDAVRAFFGSFAGTLVIGVGMIGIPLYVSMAIGRISYARAQFFYWLFAVIEGLFLSRIFAIYKAESIIHVAFITAAMFGSASLYGHLTKRDLTSVGNFLTMGLWGILIALFVNMFFQSGFMDFVISVVCVVVLTGLTAYNMQQLRNIYYSVAGNSEWENKTAVLGALILFTDVVNIFYWLLNILGERK